MKNTLALCIPAYNAAWCLPRLLDSAKKQLIPFDEILVYDDCSTDNTADVVRKYGVKLISGEINEGCSFGKNALAKLTTCGWIHFHDADDDILPNFTTLAHEWMKKQDGPDVVLLNFEYRDFQTKKLLSSPNYDLNLLREDTLLFSITHKLVNFGLYKTKAFWLAGGFDLDKKVLYNEDAAFHHRLAIAKLKFDYEPVVSCINFSYVSSMSASNANKCSEAKYHVTENLLKLNLHEKYAAEVGEIYWELATQFASVKNWSYLKKSIDKAESILKGRGPRKEKNKIFKYLVSIQPFLAYIFREYAIRLLKPSLRS